MYVGAGIVKKKGLLPFHFDFLHFPRRTPWPIRRSRFTSLDFQHGMALL